MPNVKLSVANVTGTIQRLVEKNKGLTDCEVNIRIFNTNLPDIIELEETFIINASQSKADWVVFTLGTDFSFSRRFPPVRVMKDYCPFKFKSVECGYKGYAQNCNKTLKRCRELNNSVRFGGEPTIPQGGLYASNSK